MRDSGDRSSSSAVSNSSFKHKRLGGYLVEAGLLTPAQIDVALNDQKLTGMRFGEILAARGWVKQQTIEYLMVKVILPEQEAVKQERSQRPIAKQNGAGNQLTTMAPPASNPQVGSLADESHRGEPQKQTPGRRDVPIAKPLPSVNSADGDVSWVG